VSSTGAPKGEGVLSTDAVSLSLRVATGIFKLVNRLDLVQAERVAVESNLALTMPKVHRGPGAIKMLTDLKALSAEKLSRLSKADRKGLKNALASNPGEATLEKWYRKVWPDRVDKPSLDPDQKFFTELREKRPDWNLEDPDARLAAFYVAAGRDSRPKGYEWRIALTVVDAVAEFGAENTALFVRDKQLQSVVGAVLKNFAEPDLAKFESFAGLLRHAVAATLNGALDAQGAFKGENEWLDAVLGALADARKASDDNYILGLLNGEGYPLLVGSLIGAAAGKIGAEGSGPFRGVATDVLRKAAPLVKDSSSFRGFFRNHWGDLLRAGLGSAEKHGPAMLSDANPLVKDTLVAMVGRLAKTNGTKFFTSETLYGVADAAIGVVALDPKRITKGANAPWLEELISSSLGVLSKKGLRDFYSRDGLESLLKGTLTTFAEHPELVIRKPGLARVLVGSVLTNVKAAGAFDARGLAGAAIGGALDGLSKHPELLGFNYAEIVASFSGKLARMVADPDQPLTSIQGRDILTAATEALVENPRIFKDKGAEITAGLVGAVLASAKGDPTRLLAGQTVVDVTRAVLIDFARRGAARLAAASSIKALANTLTQVLDQSLKAASKRIGKGLARGEVQVVVIELVGEWFAGSLDPSDAMFAGIVAEWIKTAAA
jgi:hypothetical protein